jgi:folate-dependent phosphoribosylglycinamide formyltransferase PurN
MFRLDFVFASFVPSQYLSVILMLPLHSPLAFILSNKKDAGILERAEKHKIPCKYIPVGGRSREAYDQEVSSNLKKAGVQLILMVRAADRTGHYPLSREFPLMNFT